MDATLVMIIDAFRAAQDRAVQALVHEFGIPMPASNLEWINICIEEGLSARRELNGTGIYVHGYGVELTFPDVTIDFDWGDKGEPDGFDTWRLFHFCECNKLYYGQYTYKSIGGWLQTAERRGELVKDRLLYYLPVSGQRTVG